MRTSYFVAKAEGPYVWDPEGNRRLDLVMSYGSAILGHAYPTVIDAVMSAAADGISFGAPTKHELMLAEAICERVPSVDSVRLTSGVAEAAMLAIRGARRFTRRSRIVQFQGTTTRYSDTDDSDTDDSGAAVAVPYNTIPILDENVACVIVEPVATSTGLVAPLQGFLEGLRAECDRVGALLIFDEVTTGFRVAPSGAQGFFSVSPDLSLFGKVIGGGFPIGALGGRGDVMEVVAALGAQQPGADHGELGNPVAAAAGVAALDMLTSGVYGLIDARARRLAEGFESAFVDVAGGVVVQRVSSLVGLRFGTGLPTDLDGANGADRQVYNRLYGTMLDRGVAMPPPDCEVCFLSMAHTDEVIDTIIVAAHEVAEML